MTAPSFTFVTTVGTSGLTDVAAKQVKSHVTKSNFAKRRARLGRIDDVTRHSTSQVQDKPQVRVVAKIQRSSLDPTESPCQATREDGFSQLVSSKWSLLFLDGSSYPNSSREAAWISLLISESALVESTMAIGFRHWSADRYYQEIACKYSSKATETVIQRIGAGRGATDAVLASVWTMAFGERLLSNEAAWKIHINGAVELLNERKAQGLTVLPCWAEDLLTRDIINDLFGFPRFYHQKLVDVTSSSGGTQNSFLVCVANLCERLADWITVIETLQASPQTSDFIVQKVIQPMQEMISEAQTIRSQGRPTLQATCITIQLIIYLSWSCSPGGIDLTAIAEELKGAICATQFRPCCYCDLTSCDFMIGALAAREGSATRAWFIKRLKRPWEIVRSHGCDDIVGMLERNMGSKTGLAKRFRSLWEELDALPPSN
ncbi:hypothetical protein F5Y18DRAFT_435203 [Xylariaceae sp. FL1019]|nr:hypothetical protein F5Y18DRAFT_435203 [Xylariaceae sp. FL1019]